MFPLPTSSRNLERRRRIRRENKDDAREDILERILGDWAPDVSLAAGDWDTWVAESRCRLLRRKLMMDALSPTDC